MHHASGRMLPVGIAHPLKMDHMSGGMVDAGDYPEAEYEEAFVKMEGKEAPGLGKHSSSSSSSSKLSEQEATNSDNDDDEGKDASSSVDSDASSSASDSEEEGQVYSQVVAKQEKVFEDRKIAPQYSKPTGIVGKPPSFPSGGQSSSHHQSTSIPGKCLCDLLL